MMEPKFVKEAKMSFDWVRAMREKLEALHLNSIWELIPPQLGMNIVVTLGFLGEIDSQRISSMLQSLPCRQGLPSEGRPRL